MKIYIAKGSGFCFGVKRAVDMAYRCAGTRKKGTVYSLREIIHNPQEVKKLEEAGARHVSSVRGIKRGSTVIVSTHGITPAGENDLKSRDFEVLDTTCPYVKKIHRIVKKLADENYLIVIIGDKEHLEVRGILGHAGRRGLVVSCEEDIKKAVLGKKIGVVSQTTQNAAEYRRLVGLLIKKVFVARQAEARVFHTICGATQNRQEETMKIAKKADVMIIIGGRNSANTKRLYELSRGILRDVHHIEGEGELKKSWFIGKKAAGVAGGASTPDRVIAAAVKKIREIGDLG
jgi:(E)-4-hydroxy-3-methyl-but-2-enyl pyrophosphate reductase